MILLCLDDFLFIGQNNGDFDDETDFYDVALTEGENDEGFMKVEIFFLCNWMMKL